MSLLGRCWLHQQICTALAAGHGALAALLPCSSVLPCGHGRLLCPCSRPCRLSLADCQHTPIGSSLHRGISGGEAKRTNVGISLISRPALLLCDEATSGLDSWNAHSVVAALRELAADGIAICGTIHSPPPDTFALFDRVLVLQRGRVVYFGENGEVGWD